MKQNQQIIEGDGSAPGPNAPVRKPVFIAVGIIVLVCAGGVVFYKHHEKQSDEAPAEAAPVQSQEPVASPPSSAKVEDEPKPVETTGAAVVTPTPPAPVPVPSVKRTTPVAENTAPRVEASPATRQMVEALTQMDLKQGPLTPEKAAEWKQNLQQLTAQGAGAVPAIRDFLEKNLDLNFDDASAALLGQQSLRLSFLQALQNIGGPEAMAVSSQMLQTSMDPREIAWLAQSLEKQAPGQYAAMAADAARSALSAASTGQLEGRDVGPLFGVLQQYGGPGAAAELASFSSQYRYYSTIALASLPDGAGIPALIQMVQDPDAVSKGGRAPALQMLAQAGLQSPEAFKVLLEQAQQNQIPTGTWLNIASILSGDVMQIGVAPVEGGIRSFHLASGNQNFYTAPDRSTWTPDQVNNYVSKIDQLLSGNNNEVAKTALQNARAAVMGRLPH